MKHNRFYITDKLIDNIIHLRLWRVNQIQNLITFY